MNTQVVTYRDQLNYTDTVETVRATVSLKFFPVQVAALSGIYTCHFRKYSLYLKAVRTRPFEPSIANTKISVLAKVVTTTNSLDGR